MDEDDNLTLTWNEYGTTYQHVLYNLRKENNFTDVTIACEKQHFLAHKLVLVTCSDFFKSILRDIHCEHPIIFLRGVDAKEMQILVDFMYVGKINVPKNELESLMETAKVLQIKGLGASVQNENNTSLIQPQKRKRLDPHNKASRANVKRIPKNSSPYSSVQNFYESLEAHYPTQQREGFAVPKSDARETSLQRPNQSSIHVENSSSSSSILRALFNSSQPPTMNYDLQECGSISPKPPVDSTSEIQVPLQHFSGHSSHRSSAVEGIEMPTLTSFQETPEGGNKEFSNVKDEPLDCSQASLLERELPNHAATMQLPQTTSKDNHASHVDIFVQPKPTNKRENTENEGRPFVCPICKKNFAKAAILKRHHLAHFRPYACKLCERSFTRREVLTEHVLEHNGADLRLPCPVCNMTIKRKRNLQAHIKVKHPEYHQLKKAALLNQES